MEEIDPHYAPPRVLCDKELLEGPNEPFTKEEIPELLKVVGTGLLAMGLIVAPWAIIGKVIEYVEFGGFEGLELPEPSEQIKKPAPKVNAPREKTSLQKQHGKLSLPRTFSKPPAPKEAFKKSPVKRLRRVQHF